MQRPNKGQYLAAASQILEHRRTSTYNQEGTRNVALSQAPTQHQGNHKSNSSMGGNRENR